MCLITLLLALLDGVLTYINTPDLKYEANPLVTVFGLGWGALFLANLIFYALYVCLAYFLFFKYESPVLQVNNVREYVSQLYYSRPDKFVWFFYKWPKNWKPLVAVGAFAYIFVSPIARSILVFEWLMITFSIQSKLYSRLCSMLPFQRFDVALAAILISFLFVFWLNREYQINQKMWETKLKSQLSMEYLH